MARDRHATSTVDHALTTVRELAATAAPISLEELDEAALLSRVDTKFAVRRDRAVELVAQFVDSYRVLDVSGCRLTTYDTRYFDTPQFGLYRQHQTGRATRLKVRRRRYCQSNTTFFEVKARTNTGRTDKTRTVVNHAVDAPLTATEHQIVLDVSGSAFINLEPSATTAFDRLTLVSPDRSERLTIDFDLALSAAQGHTSFDDLAIVEVKRANASASAGAIGALRRMGSRPSSMSKYCVAVALGADGIQRNRIKPTLLSLERLLDRDLLNPKRGSFDTNATNTAAV